MISSFDDKETMIIRYAGVMGARVRPGTAGIGAPGPVTSGDCVLVDFRKCLFAVADSPDRQPGASRSFLVKFGRLIEGLDDIDPLKTYTFSAFKEIKRLLDEETKAILATIPYGDSCTFTGILVAKTDNGLKGIVLHTGDSLLFQYAPGKKLAQISKTNFWMVGRSSVLYQVDMIDIEEGATFILATDGISDLMFPKDPGRDECLARLINTVKVEDIPGKLLDKYDTSRRPVDDLAIVTLKPQSFSPSNYSDIIGGMPRVPCPG